MLEDRDQILIELRLVAVAVAGRKKGDLAAGLLGRAHAACDCLGLIRRAQPLCQTLAGRVRMKSRDRRLAVHAQRFLQQHPSGGGAVHRVDDLGHHRNAGQAAHQVGRREGPVAQAQAFIACAHRLRAQHQMRKIDVPRMRRHVRTLRHEAQVAQVAVIDDLPENLPLEAVDFAAGRGIDGLEQRRKGIAQTEAAPTAVADVENPRELLFERRFIVERRVAPIDRMTGGGL